MTGKTSGKKDFDAPALVKTTEEHEERLKGLESRLRAIEDRVGTNEAFGKTFAESLSTSKPMENSISDVINAYDNHKLKINGMALLKWLGVLVIGGFIGALITKLCS